jgi:predicted HTH domain antitoxin
MIHRMTTIPISVEDDFAALLRTGDQPLPAAARELMALELFRRGTISSGKAAEWLGISRWDFINHASRLGIPVFQMTDEEWQAEAQIAASL